MKTVESEAVTGTDAAGELFVVGIGASAGGVEALTQLFAAMPTTLDAAFIVATHRAANRETHLGDILARHTSLPVMTAEHGADLLARHVYVMPPAMVLTLSGYRLQLRATHTDERERNPIDTFFVSLGKELQENAVGIVLSGSGSDGTLGIKAIKEEGGLTIAQGKAASGPGHTSMPASAIAGGLVDMVVPVEEIGGKLLDYVRRFGSLRRMALDSENRERDRHVQAVKDIYATLRKRVGHDFEGYKEKTFLRRVQRRMQVLQVESMTEYAEHLRHAPDEAGLLFRDLLIGVTSFFRDHPAFEAIATKVVPRLFENAGAADIVRVWIPGCSTGEEAYSIAILLREHMATLNAMPRVQIFATDIDEKALATARAGRYPAGMLDEVTPERLARHFKAETGGYVLCKEIRDLCVFSSHSVIRDPPFSRMDFISCRNLLIYLSGDVQDSVLPVFHYALKPGGFLFLGPAENISRHIDLFAPVDKKHRLFQRRPTLVSGARAQAWLSRPTQALGRVNFGRDAGAHKDQRLRNFVEGFTDIGQPITQQEVSQFRSTLNSDVASLEKELRETRERLQAIIEEYETALEELKSGNEELVSVNEELQSTNEELETSKEELQSVNEELHTVNNALGTKVDELHRANADLRNLFESTQIATVFLDRHMAIRSYTPAVMSIFNLIAADRGRPITDIAHQLENVDLRADIQQVLNERKAVEKPVRMKNGSVFHLMRILPYRTADDSVDGVLVTFVDVTAVVAAEEQQRILVSELNHRVRNMLQVVIGLANQTLHRCADLKQFEQAFMGRMQALARAYELLSRDGWRNVPVGELLRTQLSPFATEGSRYTIRGERIIITANAALALGLVLYELATNATKYGALSTAEGRIEVSWELAQTSGGERVFVFRWRESGGPPVQPPSRHGFGSELMQRQLRYELHGTAVMDFAPNGLNVTLELPAVGAALDSEQEGSYEQSAG